MSDKLKEKVEYRYTGRFGTVFHSDDVNLGGSITIVQHPDSLDRCIEDLADMLTHHQTHHYHNMECENFAGYANLSFEGHSFGRLGAVTKPAKEAAPEEADVKVVVGNYRIPEELVRNLVSLSLAGLQAFITRHPPYTCANDNGSLRRELKRYKGIGSKSLDLITASGLFGKGWHTNSTLVVPNVDLDLLDKQRLHLAEVAGEDDMLIGLLEMLDFWSDSRTPA